MSDYVPAGFPHDWRRRLHEHVRDAADGFIEERVEHGNAAVGLVSDWLSASGAQMGAWVWVVAVAGAYWPAEVLALYSNADAADRHVAAAPGTQVLSWLVREDYEGEE